MRRSSEPAGILLAAGRSRRFGQEDKLLYPLHNGTTMVLASTRALRAVLSRVVVVIRRDNLALARLLSGHGIETTIAEDADSGMGASLAAGVAATAGSQGWVVALGDMPFVQPRTVGQVVDALRRGAGIAAPVHRGQRGHPVGFSAAYRDRLLRLGGDEGGRTLLRDYAPDVVPVESDDAGVLLDVDRRLSPWPRKQKP